MATTELIGYGLAGAGLLLIAFNKFVAGMLPFLGPKALTYTIVGGIALAAVGVVLVAGGSKSSGKVKHAAPEVPIYEGTGKNRKIVGYQRA